MTEHVCSNQLVEIRLEIKDLIPSPPKWTVFQSFSMLKEEEISSTFQIEVLPFTFKTDAFSSLSPSNSFEVTPLFIEQNEETFERDCFDNEVDARFHINEEISFQWF